MVVYCRKHPDEERVWDGCWWYCAECVLDELEENDDGEVRGNQEAEAPGSSGEA